MEHHFLIDDEIYTLQVEPQPEGHLLVRIGEDEYTVEHLAEGLFTLDGRRVEALTAQQETHRHAALLGSGQYVQAEVVKSRTRRRAAAGAQGDLTAQMPGRVMEVFVTEGDTVESGQTLVLLEAMKMEMRVTAPFDGTVQTIHIEQGDTVDRGQHLLDITS